jgi:hypothetical protein
VIKLTLPSNFMIQVLLHLPKSRTTLYSVRKERVESSVN